MIETMRLGIVICDRYRACAGGKCFRAMRRREGAFSIYQGRAIELVGYTSCGGCPGGNIEYAPAEMKKNGAQVIHLATGLIVGYPPCPRIASFCSFIRTKYELEVCRHRFRKILAHTGNWAPGMALASSLTAAPPRRSALLRRRQSQGGRFLLQSDGHDNREDPSMKPLDKLNFKTIVCTTTKDFSTGWRAT